MCPVRLPLLLLLVLVAAAAAGVGEAVYIPYNTSAGVVPGKLNVHVVPHTHDDVGWLKTVDQYYVGSNNSIQGACVQNVLDSLIPALLKDENRKFIYVEQAFFQRWWRNQNDMIKDTVKGLISAGRLELINGGMCMHDEAAVHYIDMIDQTTLGHRFIKEEFGQIPRIGWQIDPFGHSAVQAYLLGAEIFAGIFPQNYEPPPGGFYFEDDPLLFDYNVEERVNDFVAAALAQANITRTNHIMFTMGTDFKYQYAETWFRNMDKLIHYVNKDGRVNALYSTPSIYTDAKYAANEPWPLKTNDFFPYADNPNAYWSGYFTSRPALKRYVRMMSGYYLAARQLEFFKGRRNSGLTTDYLGDALALAQHHDAVTGTEKQHVANDYAKRLSIGYTQAQDLVSTSLGCLTESGSKSCCSSPTTKFSQVVLVYNTLGWKREDVLRVPIEANFEQKYKYYIGQDGNGSDPQASGAYIFRPNGTIPFKTNGQITRVYKEKDYVETEFIVGPIPIDDGNGKEIATEIITNMVTNKTFYTDSSGRDFIKRIRDYRSEWKIEVHQPIAGNYYPVNLGIYLEDGSKELSILVDRSVGGSSIKDGQIELMLHRRLLHDDGRGVAEALNETVCLDGHCEGLVIQGKYYLKFDPQGEGAKWRRTFGQEIYSPLLLAFSEQDGGNWVNSHIPKYSAMDPTYNLPDNVALLTLQELEDGNVLLRFAHLYEAGEHKDLSSLASVDLKKVFPDNKIGKITETSLSANQERLAMEKKRLKWKVEGAPAKENVVRGGPVDPSKLIVELGPMEIRTFIFTPAERVAVITPDGELFGHSPWKTCSHRGHAEAATPLSIISKHMAHSSAPLILRFARLASSFTLTTTMWRMNPSN
ncbi:hypothetical protein PR202_ga22323 [Eleusine coracana subsp. coracana]|uniref:alpha-mannosidase n=1 Tax=Eleusine coracana subsp. coracana TaxID=191504 RepID=A0AAV5D2T8_ELECO|nr:hypothetical protein PR202_ga22323 [Eleusine coracana subsp. coracana]